MVTELRVHGVSGTPAESMLDRPLLHRVAGDGEAGYHRPRPGFGAIAGPGGAELEAYRWGNLTAGAAARALWLMLLPFMLANVAMWLRPPAGKAGAAAVRALCRVFGLTITGTFLLSLIGVSLDLIAWQCAAPGNPCAAGRTWLGFLQSGFFAPTGRRLAVLALVPLLVFALLWWLARRTWCRYELYPLPETADGDGLAASGFWAGRVLIGRLRSIHVAVGLTTVAAVLISVVAQHDRGWPGYVLAGAAAVILAGCLIAVCLPGMVSRDLPARWSGPLARTLRTAALILVVLALGYAVWPREAWQVTGGLPGYGVTVTSLFAGQIALLVVLGIIVLAQRPPGAFLGGLGAPILASVGLGVAVAFTAGLSYRVADLLNRAGVPSPGDYAEQPGLQPPAAHEWTAFGSVVFVLVVAIVWIVARWRVGGRLRREARAVTDADFPGARGTDPDRAAAIDGAIVEARFTDHFGPILAWAYAPLAIAAAGATALALAGIGPVELAESGSPAARALSFVTNLGTYLIGFAALGLLVVGLLAYRYAGIRRVVGVLWDLGTFWPRAAHPLAPPCYAERVVPEMVTRTTYLAEQGGLVLSGHSQGSVLAVATVLQLPARVRDRVALLTYGSPLRRLYARLFPAYVNSDVLAAVHSAVGGRWWNLWRDTDPIGGVVGTVSGHDVDRRPRDPAGIEIPPGDTVQPPILGHSGYQHDAEFERSAADLVERVQRSVPVPRARRGV